MKKIFFKQKKVWIPAILLLIVVATLVIGGKLKKSTGEKVEVDPNTLGLTGINHDYAYLPENDEDGDGLTNAEEALFETDLLDADTDFDGITDYNELYITKTNALKKDTDGDGITDGAEIQNGLDPLKKSSDGKKADSERKFDYSYNVDQMVMTVYGNANVIDTTAEVIQMAGISKLPGVIGEGYEFYCDSKFDRAELEISYADEDLSEDQIKNLGICQYTDDFKLVPVKKCKVDKKRRVVTAELEHFSKYMLCELDKINVDAVPQVMIVIDNSGSMYPSSVIQNDSESDVDFKRVDMAVNLIDMAEKDIIFGAAKFTGDYVPLSGFSSSRDDIKQQINNLKTVKENFTGTALETSLMKSIRSFQKNDENHRKFVVMLTDGESTESWAYSADEIIATAKDYEVTIINIGLGNAVDKEFLRNTAEGTEGIFINATSAYALDAVYKAIIDAINYNVADLDQDGTKESVLLGDSGFLLNQNAFPYNNYYFIDQDGNIHNGQCYGIAVLIQDYYSKTLPLTMEKSGKFLQSFNIFDKWYCPGYDITDSFFSSREGEESKNSKNILRAYKNATFDLYNYVYSVPPKERVEVQGDTLVFKQEIKDKISNNPLLGIHEVETEGEFMDKEFVKSEYLYIDVEDVNKEDLDDNLKKDYEDIMMIYRQFGTQKEDVGESFSVPSSSLSGNAQEKNVDRIIEELRNGVLLLVNDGSHCVNAVRIYRDLDNPNKYTVIIFDSNDTKREKRLEIIRRPSKVTLDVTEWVNDYIYTVYDLDGTFTKPGGKITTKYTSCQ